MNQRRKTGGQDARGTGFPLETFHFATPLPTGGALEWRAAFSAAGLRELTLLRRVPSPLGGEGRRERSERGVRGAPLADARVKRLRAAIERRIAGKRADLPWEAFDLRGRPDFHVKIWREMHAIPFGAVVSYRDVAEAAGSPLACRAAGQACKNNPIILFVPCHRVVAANGLGGFNSRLDLKKLLMSWEGIDWRKLKPDPNALACRL